MIKMFENSHHNNGFGIKTGFKLNKLKQKEICFSLKKNNILQSIKIINFLSIQLKSSKRHIT